MSRAKSEGSQRLGGRCGEAGEALLPEVELRGLTKRYGEFVALDSLSPLDRKET